MAAAHGYGYILLLPIPMNKQATILLIEDSPSQARFVQLLLENAGYAVRIASDGAEGWCRACCSHPDLILLDINLPTIDGFELLYLIKRCYMTASIPVVMLTSVGAVSDVEHAFALGADGYLCKEDYFCTQRDAHRIVDTVNQLMPMTI